MTAQHSPQATLQDYDTHDHLNAPYFPNEGRACSTVAVSAISPVVSRSLER